MEKTGDTSYLELCQNAYEEINVVENLISVIQECCLNLESNSQYYENTDNIILKISEERNRYICLLSVAHEKLKHIEFINSEIENSIMNLNQ